jgi:hypothetical protein
MAVVQGGAGGDRELRAVRPIRSAMEGGGCWDGSLTDCHRMLAALTEGYMPTNGHRSAVASAPSISCATSIRHISTLDSDGSR